MSLPATLAQHVPRHGWASTATTPQRRRNSCIGISLELGRFHLSCLTRSLAGCWTDEPPVFRAGRPRVLLLRLLSRTPEIAEPCCNITKTVRHMGFQFSTKRRNPGPAGCQAVRPHSKASSLEPLPRAHLKQGPIFGCWFEQAACSSQDPYHHFPLFCRVWSVVRAVDRLCSGNC